MGKMDKRLSRTVPAVAGAMLLLMMGAVRLSAQDSVEARLAALEARIQELEKELMMARGGTLEVGALPISSQGLRGAYLRPAVLTTAGTMEMAAAASPAPAAPPQADAPDTLGGDLEGLNFFKGMAFSGFVDGYYGYNFNQPADRSVGFRNFDFNSNSFSLNLGELNLMKAATEDSPLGFNLSYGFGPTADLVNGADPGVTADNFFQYYLSGNIGGVTLDFGKFVTIAGAEVIETGPNWNYSRGFLFGLAIPFYHMGLRATIPMGETFTLTGLLVNGWDNVKDNNSGKSVGFQAKWAPSERFTLYQNYITGPETSESNDSFRHLFDTVISVGLSENITFMTNFDYGMDRVYSDDGDAHAHWVGVAAYLRMQMGNFAFTPRYEFFSDPMGFRTGLRQQMKSLTLTPEFKINDNLTTRIEYRHDWSNKGVFPVDEEDGDPDPFKQDTALVGFILNF